MYNRYKITFESENENVCEIYENEIKLLRNRALTQHYRALLFVRSYYQIQNYVNVK